MSPRPVRVKLRKGWFAEHKAEKWPMSAALPARGATAGLIRGRRARVADLSACLLKCTTRGTDHFSLIKRPPRVISSLCSRYLCVYNIVVRLIYFPSTDN
ncbi:hypothetical protein EVAR_73296_1 [Eumeta japonica]|uniref:Uncharacterized protein n=1 Tax=Eumeta variegata TaxID=151549 RepID=A0A4C1TPB9_EUMVA|nr:hypothetical protein EVAR_73296_1 [Eumeta japonica]